MGEGSCLPGEIMPVVQRQRAKGPHNGTDQHWSMLAFESFSAGAIAVLVGILAVMAVVGAYVIVVWPLTYWDGSGLGLERYASWGETALWSVFAGGTVAGFWCFSGAAFKGKAKAKAPVVRSGRPSRV